MKRLVDTEEAARVLRVTPRAIQKKFNKGKIEGEFVNSGKGYGKGGQVLKVWIDSPNAECGVRSAESKPKDQYKVHRGEPGCNVITELKDGRPVLDPKSDVINKDVVLSSSPPSPCEVTTHASQGPLFPVAVKSNLPVATTENSSPRPIPASCQKTANLRFALIQAVKKELSKNSRPKAEIIKSFLHVYNAGISFPAIYNELKSVSRSTLYEWIRAEKDHGIDGLIPQYTGGAFSEVLPGEKNFLLKFLLQQNKPKISDAIKECKRYLGEYSATSPNTLRRFVNDFKKQFHDVWTLKREGEKAWNDKVAPYQDRDPMLLSVGEVLVADGHKLNFDVIDPITGKKKRPVLVLFWDWKSTYPVGWEIMFSENIQCIASAFRNALLGLGKIPEHIYIDNGKAFLAKVFTKKIRIEETEIPGMFARLGTDYRCALKYHGQSKPIERFFRILNDRFERRESQYRGSSIEDKPARLLRNEPIAKALEDPWVPEIEEVNRRLFQWREEYIDEPLPKRAGLTARQMFDEGKGVGLDPKALCFLMMAVEIKTVCRNRFTFAGLDWEGPCLYGYKGKVIIRYSLSDLSRIYVFDLRDQLMGIVTQAGKAHPIKDWQAAKRITADRRSYKRQTKRLADFIRSKPSLVIEGGRTPDLIEYIEAEEAKSTPKRVSPFIDSPASVEASAGEPLTDEPIRFKYAWERYEHLLKKKNLTALEMQFIEDYKSGAIAAGEWEAIYGQRKTAGGEQ